MVNRPPTGLSGLDPTWSRNIIVAHKGDAIRTWHILDTHNGKDTTDVVGTILCVHGNPTWSYLFRKVLANPPKGWRVIAVDQLNMGYSERTGIFRRLDRRVQDLCELTDELNVTGPVVTLAHDWGGPISLGWAERHYSQLAGVILANTAVHQPAEASAPTVIRTARTPGILPVMTSRTRNFIRSALYMSRPLPTRDLRKGYYAPYDTYQRRIGIEQFVADIPLDPTHPSAETLDEIALSLMDLQNIPVLLLWGPNDLVFSDLYLQDLTSRMPHADVHRYVGSSHLVVEDAPTFAQDVALWVEKLGQEETGKTTQVAQEESLPLWAKIDERSNDYSPAILEMGMGNDAYVTSFSQLSQRVNNVSSGLKEIGVKQNDRIALLIPPGGDLAAVLYGVWRAGAVAVVVDAGLGLKGIREALRGAGPDYVIGVPKALGITRLMGLHAINISTSPLEEKRKKALKVTYTLADIENLGRGKPLPNSVKDSSDAAVVFTSGATGPPKGVTYTHAHLQSQRDALINLYKITPNDRLVAAFGPFALFGPALGILSATPNMNMSKPSTLTATALADAVAASKATLVFGSPAALANIISTADRLSERQRQVLTKPRLLLSTGAPVPLETLYSIRTIIPNAIAHTPYGMTEMLPVADIDIKDLEHAGAKNGICVGYPVPEVSVTIQPLNVQGEPSGEPVITPGVTGEICISSNHGKREYDKLYFTEQASRIISDNHVGHRSGDVGHFDEKGRLWVEGRLAHVVTTPTGPVTPYALETAVKKIQYVQEAAAVGVGPVGNQTVVIVITIIGEEKKGLAQTFITHQVRNLVATVSDCDVSAVLVAKTLPVDIRHNSKIDRKKVSVWATRILAGGRAKKI